MKNSLLFQKKQNKGVFKCLFVLSFLFSTVSLFGQEIVVNKYAVENGAVCNQFDVTLEIIGNPPPQPQEVVLIIDVSGSMARGGDPTPIDYAQIAAKDFVNQFFLPANNPTGENKISLVVFDQTASLIVPLTNATNSGQSLAIAAIDAINITNSDARTNTEDALVTASEQLTTNGTFDCATNRSIILLSDGVPTSRNLDGGGTADCGQTSVVTACQTEAIGAGIDAQTTTIGLETYDQNIFTIGLIGAIDDGSAEENLAISTLNQIQNTGAFITEDNADLTGIYDQILGQLVAAATQLPGQALVTDTVVSGFTIIPGSITTTKGIGSFSGQIISWNVDKVNNETITLNYSIQLNDTNICGNQDGYGLSVINYEDSSCNSQSVEFTNPTICIPCPEIAPSISQVGCNSIDYSSTFNPGDCGDPTTSAFAWEFFIDGNSVGTSITQNGNI